MAELDVVSSFKQAVEHLKGGYPQKASLLLKSCVESDRSNPYYLSFLGLAIARAKKGGAAAAKLCETALEAKKNELQFHLNLAEVYASMGRREDAVAALDQARETFGANARLAMARLKVGKRRSPMIPFLDRSHLLNKNLGKLRHGISKKFSAV